MFKINTLFTFKCEESCWDCLEWCPFDEFNKYFACASYNYTGQQRLGTIHLFSIDAIRGLAIEQIVRTDGILDLKWCTRLVQGRILLAVATASNSIDIYEFSNLHLQLLTRHNLELNECDKKHVLLLSIDWSDGLEVPNEPLIVCSSSNGTIHILKLTQTNLLELNRYYEAHKYEAWTVSFYTWCPNLILSGGDDHLMLQYDIRLEQNQPIYINKSHNAGVINVQTRRCEEYSFFSGSYDSLVRFWDIRSLKDPINSLVANSSPWKLKVDPFNNNILGMACMECGVQFIEKTSLKCLGECVQHGSLVYGLDWSNLNVKEVKKFDPSTCIIFASCSFYDKLICVSSLEW